MVAVCRIGDVCCLPAPAHQPFSFNSLGLSAPEEACSRNVRASGNLKIVYEGIFKIYSWSLLMSLLNDTIISCLVVWDWVGWGLMICL